MNREYLVEVRRDGDAQKEQRMNTTREIVDRHLKCFGEGNLDGILADYAETAVLFMPDAHSREPTR